MAGRTTRAGILQVVVLAAVAGGGFAQDGPRRGRDAHALALERERAGDHAGALSLLWEAAALLPRDAEIQQRLGEALERIGALDGAIEAYGRALAADPASRRASSNLILALAKAGRGSEAVAHARARVLAAPDDAHAHFTLGLAQSEQDIEDALRAFRRALDLDPRHTLARYNLALVLKRADRLTEAADELKRALAIEPQAEAHYALGVIHWHQGEGDRAIAALRKAIALAPAYADAHYTLGAVLKERRDLAGAVDALRRAIALRPDLWGAHYTLAQVYELAGNADAARAQRDHAERLRERAAREQEAGVATSVGTARLDAGDPAGALEHFRRAAGVLDEYAPAHYQMGRALRALGDEGAARAAFARARQLNPSLAAPPP